MTVKETLNTLLADGVVTLYSDNGNRVMSFGGADELYARIEGEDRWVEVTNLDNFYANLSVLITQANWALENDNVRN